MKRIIVPDTELSLSPVGMGCVNAGLKWDGKDADYMLDAYYDMGGNVYDSARVYSDWIPPETGRSERVLGDWLGRSKKRDKVILITKGGHPDMTVPDRDMHRSRMTRKDMVQDLELSLKTLRTDYIDIYFYHRDDLNQTTEELVETMESFVKEGKIRYYACSNWTTARMREADAYCKEKGYRGFVANEVLFNAGSCYMQLRDDTLVKMDAEMEVYHRTTPKNLVMPYSGLCHGFFNTFIARGEDFIRDSQYYSEGNIKMKERIEAVMEKYGVTATQAVLGFFTCRDFVCLPLFGARNMDDLKEMKSIFEIPFVKEDYEDGGK